MGVIGGGFKLTCGIGGYPDSRTRRCDIECRSARRKPIAETTPGRASQFEEVRASDCGCWKTMMLPDAQDRSGSGRYRPSRACLASSELPRQRFDSSGKTSIGSSCGS